MKVKLVVIGGKKNGMVIPISTPKFRIGRGDRCHIRPQNDLVGELHCQISVDGNSVTLEDNGAAVGTFVNGKRVQQRCRLQNNDRIKIAALEFAVQLTIDGAAAQKQPVLKADDAAGRTPAVSADDKEADILQWVKQEEEVRTSPIEVVTPPYAKPETKGPAVAPTPEPKRPAYFSKDFEWDPMDILLLVTVGPLAAFLLSYLPAFWAWRGGGVVLLTVMAFLFKSHVKRMEGIKWDELNIAMGVLAVLVMCLMLPSYWVWPGGGIAFLVVFSLIVWLRMKRMTGNKLDDTNVALLAAIVLLVHIVNPLSSIAQWGQLDWSVIALAGIVVVLGLRMKRMAGNKWDDTNMAMLAAIALLVHIVTTMWQLARMWTRLGGVVVPLGVFAILFEIRARRMVGNRLDGFNLLLLAQIGILTVSLLHQLLPNIHVWRGAGVLLLVALIPLTCIRIVRTKESRLNELNLALLAQIGLLGLFVANLRMPSVALLSVTHWGQLEWSIFAAVLLSFLLGLRTNRMTDKKLDDTNIALLAAIALLVHTSITMWPAAVPWMRLSGAVIPLIAFIVLLGIRVWRTTGSRLDGLNLLLLVQVGILAVSSLHLMLRDLLVWQAGTMFLLAVLIPSLCIHIVRTKENRMNEINLALLLQTGMLGPLLAKFGLPSTSQLSSLLSAPWWRWPGWGIIAIVVLSLMLGLRLTRRASRKLDDTNVALMAAIALLTFIVIKMLPSAVPWMRLGGAAVPLAILTVLFGIRAIRMAGNRLDRLNLVLLIQMGILAISVLYLVLPDFVVWQHGVVLLLAVFIPLLGIGVVRMRGSRLNEISLALLLQMGTLAYFAANWWLPPTLWPFASRPVTLQFAALPPSMPPSAKAIPAKKTPKMIQTTKIPLAKEDSGKKPPIANPPAQMPPATVQSTEAKLAKNKPAADPQAKAPPAKGEPPQHSLIANPPAQTPPAALKPAKAELARNQPPADPPAQMQPAKKDHDAKDPPIANPLAKNPPVVNQPAQNRPVVNPPAANPPAKTLPAKTPPRTASPATPSWAARWKELGGTLLPLVALAALFGIRTRRMIGNKLDGLGLLLLSQIGILAVAVLHRMLPSWHVWQGGTVLLLAVLIPLMCIYMVRMNEGKMNEVNLALLVQIGLLAMFIANWWLPSLGVRIVAGVFLLAALLPLLGMRMVLRNGQLNEIDVVLLMQMSMFAFVIANQWLPSLWVRIGEGAILVAALTMVLWLHNKRAPEGKSDQVFLRLVAIGIWLVVVLGFLFPITSWWPS